MKIAHTWISRIGIRNTSLHTATKSENFHEQNLQSSLAWKNFKLPVIIFICLMMLFPSFFIISKSSVFIFHLNELGGEGEGQVGGMQCHWMCSEWWKWKCNFCSQQRALFPGEKLLSLPTLEQQLAAAPPFYFSLLVEISDSVFPQHHLSFRAIHLTMQTTQLSQFRQTSTLFCWASGNNRAWARTLTRRKCAGKSFVWANCAVE